MTFDEIVARVEMVTGSTPKGMNGTRSARCPAHDDHNPSLSISVGDDGRTLLRCQAGCAVDDVTKALGIATADLFEKPLERAAASDVVAAYDYVDEGGNLLFQVVRKSGKRFTQRRPDGHGGWIFKLDDTRRVLYRLPEVLDAVAADAPVFVLEGEKDCDAAWRAGYAATCNPGGAGKWRQEYADTLRGADVVVVADLDEPGRRHAAAVAASLTGVAATLRCAEPLHGKDLADHLAAGHTVDELVEVDGWMEPVHRDEHLWIAAPPAALDEATFDLDESMQPVDLAAVLDGSVTQPIPSQLHRDDGQALFYAASVNGIHADSGIGKGWIICDLIRQNARRGRRTMLIDLEDIAVSIVSRLLALGMQPHEIVTFLLYVRPQVPIGPGAVEHLVSLTLKHSIAATVIDSLGEAFALAGVNEDRDNEVGPWLRMVTRPLADTGAAVVLVDHSTKAADNPLHPSGSKRKRAAITGASYLVEAVKPFVKGDGGRLRLTCAKDRHGSYRRGEVVADLVMTSGTTTARLDLYAPSPALAVDATVPTILAARAAITAAKKAGGQVSRASLEGLMTIKASATVKRGGIDYAAAAGALTESSGPRNARLYVWVHDLDEETT